MMLQGLSTNLGVSLSFMPLLAKWAQHTLLEHARVELAAAQPHLLGPPPAFCSSFGFATPLPTMRATPAERMSTRSHACSHACAFTCVQIHVCACVDMCCGASRSQRRQPTYTCVYICICV